MFRSATDSLRSSEEVQRDILYKQRVYDEKRIYFARAADQNCKPLYI